MSSAIEVLSEMITEYESRGYYNLRIEINEIGDYDSNYEIINLVGTRLETDQEREIRLTKERKEKEKRAAIKKKQDQKDLEIYLKLKKKFEK